MSIRVCWQPAECAPYDYPKNPFFDMDIRAFLSLDNLSSDAALLQSGSSESQSKMKHHDGSATRTTS